MFVADGSYTSASLGWFRWYRICLQCGRPGFSPRVGKISLEKEMTTHSSVLALRIPWTEKPGGPQSTESRRVGQDWATDTLTTRGSTRCLLAGGSHASDISGTYLIISHDSHVKLFKEKREREEGREKKGQMERRVKKWNWQEATYVSDSDHRKK